MSFYYYRFASSIDIFFCSQLWRMGGKIPVSKLLCSCDWVAKIVKNLSCSKYLEQVGADLSVCELFILRVQLWKMLLSELCCAVLWSTLWQHKNTYPINVIHTIEYVFYFLHIFFSSTVTRMTIYRDSMHQLNYLSMICGAEINEKNNTFIQFIF